MEPNDSSARIVDILQKIPLFAGMSATQLEKLVPLFKFCYFKANEIIIREGEDATELYVVWEGELEVLKKADDRMELCIANLKGGEVLGEMGLLDSAPRSASVRALSASKLLAISIADINAFRQQGLLGQEVACNLVDIVTELKTDTDKRSIYTNLMANLAHLLSMRLRNTSNTVLDSLKCELELNKSRVSMSKFMLNVMLVMAVYIYLLKIIEKIALNNITTNSISMPILIFFAIAVLIIMRGSGYSMQFYGITLENWRQSLKDGLILSIILILFIILIKLLAIKFVAQFHNLSLIQFNFGVSKVHASTTLNTKFLAVFGYLIMTPIQELIARGALQSSLQEFLSGSHKTWWAIFMSNILFSVTHVHISLSFALFVLMPGICWGWMYSRNKTLIGVSISHLLVGGAAFFIFDLKSVFSY